MRVSVKIDPVALQGAIGEALGAGAESGLEHLGLVITKRARDEAPVDSGSLRSSIMSHVSGRGLDAKVEVGPNVKSKDGAPYDIYQELGTGIYKEDWNGAGSVYSDAYIRPRKSSALRFRPQGKGFSKIITYNQKGKGTLRSTKFHEGFVFAKFVRGTKPVHYMRTGIEKTDIGAEFVKGFNASRKVARRG